MVTWLILEHRRTEQTVMEAFAAVFADETHSTQPGTAAWEGFGR